MGGDQNKDELLECLNIAKKHNLKTCLYTGSDKIDYSIIKKLDYVKIGRYIKELGGLDSETTNQRMYDLTKNKEIFFNRKGYKYGN